MKLQLVAILFCSLLFAIAQPSWARKWTDNTGKYHIDAELVEVEDGMAVLKRSDGVVIRVPLTRLSKADQKFARQQATEPAAANKLPSLPGAMTEPPEWLANDPNVPFDLEKFFRAPSPEDNAARHYIIAFAEFDASLAILVHGIDPERELEKAKSIGIALRTRHKAAQQFVDQFWAFEDDSKKTPEPPVKAALEAFAPYRRGVELLRSKLSANLAVYFNPAESGIR